MPKRRKYIGKARKPSVGKKLKKTAKEMGKGMYSSADLLGKAAVQTAGVQMDWSKERETAKRAFRALKKIK